MNINNVTIGFILYVGEIKMFKYKVARKNNETIYSWFLRTCFKNGISPKELFLFEYNTFYYSKNKLIQLIEKYLGVKIEANELAGQKFCPECTKEQYQATGELLFKASEQTELYTTCLIHNQPLLRVKNLFFKKYDYDTLILNSSPINSKTILLDSKISLFAQLYMSNFKCCRREFFYIIIKKIITSNFFIVSKGRKKILIKEPLFKQMSFKGVLCYSEILEYFYLSNLSISDNMAALILVSLFENETDFNRYLKEIKINIEPYVCIGFLLKITIDYLKTEEVKAIGGEINNRYEKFNSKSITPMKAKMSFVFDKISHRLYLIEDNQLKEVYQGIEPSEEDEISSNSPIYKIIACRGFKRRYFRERYLN